MQHLEKDSNGFVEKSYEEKNGKLHGECVLFYSSGEIKGRSFYLEGILDGPSSFFSEEGVLLSTTFFQGGKPEGSCRRFYRTGALYADLQYKDGLLEGKQQYFYENQILKSLLFYKEGLLDGEVVLYFPSSKLKRRCFYKSGMKSGIDTIYSEEGIVLDEGDFIEGLPVGIHRRRFLSGNLKEEKKYHTPKKNERWEWDDFGHLRYEGIYLDETRFQETRYGNNEHKEVKQGIWDGNRIRWIAKGD